MEKQRFTRFWLIIAAAFLLVVIFLSAWFISQEISARELFEAYNQQQFLLVNGASSGMEGLFDDLTASLGALANRPEIQRFDEESSRRELAQKMVELTPLGIRDIGVLDSSGTARFFAVERKVEGVNFAWRSYFKSAQEISSSENDQDTIIEIQSIAQGETGFTIAIPMLETTLNDGNQELGGHFRGLILGSLTLDTLAERYIAPFKPPGGGQIYLIDQDYDITWSSDPQTRQRNLLGIHYPAFEELVDRLVSWQDGPFQGGSYIFTPASRAESEELVAYSPIQIGADQFVLFIRTPASVARQTSISTFQSQQYVFLLSIITLLLGILLGGLVLRRESQRRYQAEAALRASETKQAILTERNRLAADLHDSVTQGLYGVVLHADAASGQLSAGNKDRAADYLQEIKQTAKEGLAEMRLLIFELRPPILEKEGLVSALEARLYAVEKRAGLTVNLDSELEERLPKQVEEVLYRIAQESLNNILKHAQAKSVHLRLNRQDDVVTLAITDDGKGFDPSAARQQGGIGLTNMIARASKIEGHLEIISHPGKGTKIQVEVKT